MAPAACPPVFYAWWHSRPLLLGIGEVRGQHPSAGNGPDVSRKVLRSVCCYMIVISVVCPTLLCLPQVGVTKRRLGEGDFLDRLVQIGSYHPVRVELRLGGQGVKRCDEVRQSNNLLPLASAFTGSLLQISLMESAVHFFLPVLLSNAITACFYQPARAVTTFPTSSWWADHLDVVITRASTLLTLHVSVRPTEAPSESRMRYLSY